MPTEHILFMESLCCLCILCFDVAGQVQGQFKPSLYYSMHDPDRCAQGRIKPLGAPCQSPRGALAKFNINVIIFFNEINCCLFYRHFLLFADANVSIMSLNDILSSKTKYIKY